MKNSLKILGLLIGILATAPAIAERDLPTNILNLYSPKINRWEQSALLLFCATALRYELKTYPIIEFKKNVATDKIILLNTLDDHFDYLTSLFTKESLFPQRVQTILKSLKSEEEKNALKALFNALSAWYKKAGKNNRLVTVHDWIKPQLSQYLVPDNQKLYTASALLHSTWSNNPTTSPDRIGPRIYFLLGYNAAKEAEYKSALKNYQNAGGKTNLQQNYDSAFEIVFRKSQSAWGDSDPDVKKGFEEAKKKLEEATTALRNQTTINNSIIDAYIKATNRHLAIKLSDSKFYEKDNTDSNEIATELSLLIRTLVETPWKDLIAPYQDLLIWSFFALAIQGLEQKDLAPFCAFFTENPSPDYAQVASVLKDASQNSYYTSKQVPPNNIIYPTFYPLFKALCAATPQEEKKSSQETTTPLIKGLEEEQEQLKNNIAYNPAQRALEEGLLDVISQLLDRAKQEGKALESHLNIFKTTPQKYKADLLNPLNPQKPTELDIIFLAYATLKTAISNLNLWPTGILNTIYPGPFFNQYLKTAWEKTEQAKQNENRAFDNFSKNLYTQQLIQANKELQVQLKIVAPLFAKLKTPFSRYLITIIGSLYPQKNNPLYMNELNAIASICKQIPDAFTFPPGSSILKLLAPERIRDLAIVLGYTPTEEAKTLYKNMSNLIAVHKLAPSTPTEFPKDYVVPLAKTIFGTLTALDKETDFLILDTQKPDMTNHPAFILHNKLIKTIVDIQAGKKINTAHNKELVEDWLKLVQDPDPNNGLVLLKGTTSLLFNLILFVYTTQNQFPPSTFFDPTIESTLYWRLRGCWNSDNDCKAFISDFSALYTFPKMAAPQLLSIALGHSFISANKIASTIQKKKKELKSGSTSGTWGPGAFTLISAIRKTIDELAAFVGTSNNLNTTDFFKNKLLPAFSKLENTPTSKNVTNLFNQITQNQNDPLITKFAAHCLLVGALGSYKKLGDAVKIFEDFYPTLVIESFNPKGLYLNLTDPLNLFASYLKGFSTDKNLKEAIDNAGVKSIAGERALNEPRTDGYDKISASFSPDVQLLSILLGIDKADNKTIFDQKVKEEINLINESLSLLEKKGLKEAGQPFATLMIQTLKTFAQSVPEIGINIDPTFTPLRKAFIKFKAKKIEKNLLDLLKPLNALATLDYTQKAIDQFTAYVFSNRALVILKVKKHPANYLFSKLYPANIAGYKREKELTSLLDIPLGACADFARNNPSKAGLSKKDLIYKWVPLSITEQLQATLLVVSKDNTASPDSWKKELGEIKSALSKAQSKIKLEPLALAARKNLTALIKNIPPDATLILDPTFSALQKAYSNALLDLSDLPSFLDELNRICTPETVEFCNNFAAFTMLYAMTKHKNRARKDLKSIRPSIIKKHYTKNATSLIELLKNPLSTFIEQYLGTIKTPEKTRKVIKDIIRRNTKANQQAYTFKTEEELSKYSPALEQEKLEKEKLKKEETERLEKERIEQEKLEKEKLEKDRIEKERIEKEEAERLEKERLEKLEEEKSEKETQEILKKLAQSLRAIAANA